METKIAVSASGRELNAQIDPRFGRCAFFLLIDPETMTWEAYDNGNIALGGGAGIQSAQFVASKGAKVVITGNCGPNAVRTLSAAGIEVILGQSGNVREAVEAYLQGKLSGSREPNVSDHHGVEQATACTTGMGRGMGVRGGGQCTKSGPGDPLVARSGWKCGRPSMGSRVSSPDGTGEATVETLKSRVELLRREIEVLEARIKSTGREP